ncbi:MAG: type II toxin-antitoxin system RelE/ParE family toxin [Bacteroidota bacterium]
MRAILITEGPARRVLALSRSDDAPIYQDELFQGLDHRSKKKIVNYIAFLSKSKFPVVNINISKPLKGYHNLYELRPLPVRLFFFMIGNDAVITHGIVKKKDKTDKKEIQRAENLKAIFIKGDGDDA